jgi:hypothetical protein
MAKWTEERRKKQAEAIKRWKPWEKSTGPKTKDGKARIRLNACKHGFRSQSATILIEMLNANKAFIALAILYANHDSAVKQRLRYKRTNKNRLKSRADAPTGTQAYKQTNNTQ